MSDALREAAQNALKARGRFGWGHQADAALEALRAALSAPPPVVPAGWQQPGPVTAGHPLDCLIVLHALRQSDGEWYIGGSKFLADDEPLAWMPDTDETRAAIAAAPQAPTQRDPAANQSQPQR